MHCVALNMLKDFVGFAQYIYIWVLFVCLPHMDEAAYTFDFGFIVLADKKKDEGSERRVMNCLLYHLHYSNQGTASTQYRTVPLYTLRYDAKLCGWK